MEITLAMIKELRESTHAGVMDCKKALLQSNGDFAAAEKVLKEMGLAAVAKRVDRSTNEGRVTILQKDNKFVMVDITCETDFVAKNNEFINLGKNVAEKILSEGYTQIEQPLVEMVNGLIATINENMKVKRFALMECGPNQYVATYIHGEGKIGVLIRFNADDPKILSDEAFKDFAFKCALQVCAQDPMYLDGKDVPKDYCDEQLGIFRKQVESLDKPENVKEGIVRGKLSKHLGEICLNQQVFDFDNPDGLTVEKLFAKFNKDHGCKTSIESFVRYRAGGND
ncbi:MAG: translation elongation factor Ts [Sphaerochaetaceae bacterium]|jgi:elongation factor Ts|nr:translation elongation factor Ts [Sphaerochaetaceae bacterium]MDD3163316.1 translation elongation factor Ts [Sphaerochaetaceae bacterium]MDD4007282.1 translation elongation factor Ts [Sphaerochaetaceae bacterium]MDD4396399.1 translation elongation factor Ts [Sphaerochaetaceae bacterium]